MAFRLSADFFSVMGVSSAVVSELAAFPVSGPKERRRVERFFFVGFGRDTAGREGIVSLAGLKGQIQSESNGFTH